MPLVELLLVRDLPLGVISVHGLLGAVDDLDLSSSFLALSSVMSWFLISTLRPDSAMAVGGEGEEGCGERRPRAPARQDQAWRRGRRKLMDVWKDPGPGLSRRDRGAGQDSALGPGAA
ncbi:unnamed protein product, partial [Prorocentrum cordatum]